MVIKILSRIMFQNTDVPRLCKPEPLLPQKLDKFLKLRGASSSSQQSKSIFRTKGDVEESYLPLWRRLEDARFVSNDQINHDKRRLEESSCQQVFNKRMNISFPKNHKDSFPQPSKYSISPG